MIKLIIGLATVATTSMTATSFLVTQNTSTENSSCLLSELVDPGGKWEESDCRKVVGAMTCEEWIRVKDLTDGNELTRWLRIIQNINCAEFLAEAMANGETSCKEWIGSSGAE